MTKKRVPEKVALTKEERDYIGRWVEDWAKTHQRFSCKVLVRAFVYEAGYDCYAIPWVISHKIGVLNKEGKIRRVSGRMWEYKKPRRGVGVV